MKYTAKKIAVEKLQQNKGQIEGLPKNPRLIRDARFEALKKSIEDAPEMLELRELLVYPIDKENYVVIGGNMRLEACRDLGHEEVPCKVIDKSIPADKLREYVIKDNVAFGDTDYDILANEWDNDELLAWGMEIWDGSMPDQNIEDEPPMELDGDLKEKPFVAKIRFESDIELNKFQKEMYNVIVDKYNCTISISGGEL